MSLPASPDSTPRPIQACLTPADFAQRLDAISDERQAETARLMAILRKALGPQTAGPPTPTPQPA